MPVSVDYSGLLFRMTILDAYFRCLFQITFPDVGCLRMTVSDYCSRWIFRMLVSNDFFGWLFVSTTDSCFSGQSIFPRSIPISTYHSTDWSHDWFVFERQLPTAELWPRSPLILNYSEFVWVVLIDIFHECFELNWHGEEFFFFFSPVVCKMEYLLK